MTAGRVHTQPQSWWGWHGWYNRPDSMSVTRLIRAGNFSARVAGLFWLGLERGASIIVAADPPRAGKTTTLTALLAFAPQDAQAHYTCGWGETFDVPPLEPGQPTYLLINEISDHLPIYTWGPYVVRAFELLQQGYSLASTMHASSTAGVVRQLTVENGVPLHHLARLTFIVPMGVWVREGGVLRRVLEVTFLQPSSSGSPEPQMDRVVRWEPETDRFHVLESPGHRQDVAAWMGMTPEALAEELDRREAYLTGLVAAGVEAAPDVLAAIHAYRTPD
ncbi:MAG TPA: hypothetical protein VIO14_04860 [Dehalococcoidia bacterium]